MAVKTWTRATDYSAVPCTMTYTSGSATNWQEHTAPIEALTVLVVNEGTSTAYVAQGVQGMVDGDARSGAKSGIAVLPGGSQRLDFGDLIGNRSVGVSAATFFTIGTALRFHFSLLF